MAKSFIEILWYSNCYHKQQMKEKINQKSEKKKKKNERKKKPKSNRYFESFHVLLEQIEQTIKYESKPSHFGTFTNNMYI